MNPPKIIIADIWQKEFPLVRIEQDFGCRSCQKINTMDCWSCECIEKTGFGTHHEDKILP